MFNAKVNLKLKKFNHFKRVISDMKSVSQYVNNNNNS